MKHKIPFRLLSEYLDNKCSEGDRKMIESHLPSCDSCRKNLLLLKNSNLAMQNLDRAATSDRFDYELNNKLYQRLKFRDEKRIAYILNDIIANIKAALIPSRVALAKAFIFLLFFTLAYGALKYYVVQPAQIILVWGKTAIYRAKEAKWVDGKKGLDLAAGDIIKVDKDSHIDITHPERYVLRVKENSQIKVAKLLPRFINGAAIYRLEKGKVLASLTERFKGSRFIVETPEATATALGTEFLVDVSVEPVNMTRFGVFQGKIKVEGVFVPKEHKERREVVVYGGEATKVYKDQIPLTPRQLLDKEWSEMVEFYQIGKKTQVALLISNGRHRTRELLRPCPIYISDMEPRTVSESLEKTIAIIDKAIKTKDRAMHLEGIKMLEEVLAKYPDASYEPQLLLFIASYYNYLNMPEKAREAFGKVADKYPDSTFASMALYAIGIIYDEKIGDSERARHYYDLVRRSYPHSPEAAEISELRKK